MARNSTPVPKSTEAPIDHPPPPSGGAFRRLPNGELVPLEPVAEPKPPAPPAEQSPIDQSGE
ncbi:MAG: hypothetical protein ACK4JB_17285 [Reyranella sp.]